MQKTTGKTKYNTLRDVELALARYIPAVKKFTGKDITLERIRPMMELLGNPQNKLKIIHIAGTSGKTSTAYYLHKLLQGSGRKAGLTVSPHIDSLTERIQINSKQISEQELCRAMEQFMDLIKGVSMEPSYFELLVAFAYWYFAQQDLDYVVVETGFGGLHDATNIAQQPDKICVITDIGYDHTHILGNTLPEIAAQKAGIIHNGNQVFTFAQAKEITNEFIKRSQEVLAHISVFDQYQLLDDFGLNELATLPLYQQRNWILARAVAENIAVRDNWKLDQKQVKSSLQVQVPGRMDVINVNGSDLIMDGAHNQQKMQAFIKSYQKIYGNKQATILLSFKHGRDYEQVLPQLHPICNKLIITSFLVTQDMQISSMDPEELAGAAKDFDFEQIQILPDVKEALRVLLADPADQKIITGSFYLLSEAREQLGNL